MPSFYRSPIYLGRAFLHGYRISATPIKLRLDEKLDCLRRVDHFRHWYSLDDRRRCLQCGHIITGRQIEFLGGTRFNGPLRAQCPTKDCPSEPMDWALVHPPRPSLNDGHQA